MATEDPALEYLRKQLLRHFVCVCIGVRRLGESTPAFNAYSGFLVSIDGSWVVVTAGHVLEEIYAFRESKTQEISHLVLAFDFSGERLQTVDFPVDRNSIGACYNNRRSDGQDIAVLAVPRSVQGELESAGHVAANERQWACVDEIETERHMMLGLPCEFVSQTFDLNIRGELELCQIDPVIISVIHREVPPDQSAEWLCFGIGHEEELQSIKGMSGGPVFGFRRDEGELRYWIIGAQSWWKPRSRLAFTTKLGAFIRDLADDFHQFQHDHRIGRRNKAAPGYLFSRTDSGLLVPEEGVE